jgi:hypothetical protein
MAKHDNVDPFEDIINDICKLLSNIQADSKTKVGYQTRFKDSDLNRPEFLLPFPPTGFDLHSCHFLPLSLPQVLYLSNEDPQSLSMVNINKTESPLARDDNKNAMYSPGEMGSDKGHGIDPSACSNKVDRPIRNEQ